jgi:hypothetical protein
MARSFYQRRVLVLLLFCLYAFPVISQDCNATKLCATGCCSQFGFCGTDSAHCGAGCLSTCDYKLGCDASNPLLPELVAVPNLAFVDLDQIVRDTACLTLRLVADTRRQIVRLMFVLLVATVNLTAILDIVPQGTRLWPIAR